jgi:uncharacterized protein YndB with AHSA1/START domain
MSDAQAMRFRFRHEQLVRAPLEAVWAADVDPVRQPEWQSNLHSVEVLTPGPVIPGMRYRLHAQVAGRHIPVDVEVIEMDPMRVITYRMDVPTQKFTTLDRTEMTDVGDGVLVTMSSWFLRIGPVQLGLSKAFRFMEKRRLRDTTARFAAVVEQGLTA